LTARSQGRQPKLWRYPLLPQCSLLESGVLLGEPLVLLLCNATSHWRPEWYPFRNQGTSLSAGDGCRGSPGVEATGHFRSTPGLLTELLHRGSWQVCASKRLMHCSKSTPDYSITWVSTPEQGDNVMPRALSVLRCAYSHHKVELTRDHSAFGRNSRTLARSSRGLNGFDT
jgi:hypothetical protein